MKSAALAVIMLLCAIPATSTIWEQTLLDLTDNEIITVDLAGPIVTIESISVHMMGTDKVGGWWCDGMEGSDTFAEYHFVDGTFGQDGPVDDMSVRPQVMDVTSEYNEFDITYQFDVSDFADWAFLGDGPTDFLIHTWGLYYSPGGFCQHIFGIFDLDLLSLTIVYNGSVANEKATWGAIKAMYR